MTECQVYLNIRVMINTLSNSRTQVTSDYYVLARLRGEDDESCSRAQWVKGQISDFGGDQRGIAACLSSRQRRDVQEWAGRTFEKRPECYVWILEHQHKGDFPITFLQTQYASPGLGTRISYSRIAVNPPELEQILVFLDEALAMIVLADDQRERDEKRRLERGRGTESEGGSGIRN